MIFLAKFYFEVLGSKKYFTQNNEIPHFIRNEAKRNEESPSFKVKYFFWHLKIKFIHFLKL